MKDYLADLVRASPTPAHGRNVAREYLQARILGALQRAGAMIPLAFHGGTALRFLPQGPVTAIRRIWTSRWKATSHAMTSVPACTPSGPSWPRKAMPSNSR